MLAAQRVSYLPFEAVNPFTMTLTGRFSPGELNLEEVFYQLPIADVNFKPKGGKKIKIDVIGQPGQILAAKAKIKGVRKVRGIDTGTAAFNNCINVVITVPDVHGGPEKNIDFKLFKDNIQTTGSRTMEHTYAAWEAIRGYLSQMKNVCSTPVTELSLSSLAYKMIDKSFDLGFRIDREALKNQLHNRNGFHVIWEAGINSNGVSVKYPLEAVVAPLRKSKKMPRCVSLIFFATGKFIMSCDNLEDMNRVYCLAQETIAEIRGAIEHTIKKR